MDALTHSVITATRLYERYIAHDGGRTENSK